MMTTPTTIHLIRHGEVHNPQQVMYARLPGFRLSERGRQQAQAAGMALRERPLAALFSSPQQRAQETAALIAEAHSNGGLPVHTETLIDEIHSPHQGRPLAELEATGWDLYTGIGADYEHPPAILDRTLTFINGMRAAYAGREVAAVTHGDIVTFMILFAHGIAPVDMTNDDKSHLLVRLGLPEIYPATASISSFTFATAADELPAFSYLRPY